MIIIRLSLRKRSVSSSRPALNVFASTSLCRVYFPGRGLPYSLLIHSVTLLVLSLAPVSRLPIVQAQSQPRTKTIDLSEWRVVMYLPLLESGGQGAGPSKGGSEASRKVSSVASAPGIKGLNYPGPQPIVSDLPQPTNSIQTLLQPALKNPPILPPPLPLPNIVQIAETGLVPPMEPPAPAPKTPDAAKPEAKAVPPPSLPVEFQPPKPIDSSKLLIPASISPLPAPTTKAPEVMTIAPPAQITPPPNDSNTLEKSRESEEQPKVLPPATPEKSKEAPAAELFPQARSGSDMVTLLSLTPLPAVREQRVEVPLGEARGHFAISPEPNLDATEKEPGSKKGIASSATVIGNPAASPAANTPPVANAAIGGAAGAAKDKEVSSSGSGADAAPGTRGGSAPGSGGGTGTGKGAFSGITIVGGVWDAGDSANSVPPGPPPRPLQTSYGLYVVSTEGSGGGLPSFGVFSDEHVYTVYLDMRQTATDSTPTWILEFAAPQETRVQVNAPENTRQDQQGLVLPFPAVKEPPTMPADLVRAHLRKMLIVFAIINIEGKMEQISVKESPDPLLNEPVLNVLSGWVFRPALLDGKPVAVKVLMGIPVWR